VSRVACRVRMIAAAALAACSLCAAAGEGAARPDGGAIGTVAARRGNLVVVVAAEGVVFAEGQELVVGRSEFLVAFAKGQERVEAWGAWAEAGRVRARIVRGGRCCIAFITKETPRAGIDGKPAPNIRPGDTVRK